MKTSVELDYPIWGKKDARRVSLPAGLNLIARTREVEQDAAGADAALQHDVSENRYRQKIAKNLPEDR